MKEDIIKMAQEAGCSEPAHPMNDWHVSQEALERFFHMAQAAERNKVAQWMIGHSYATGHGDTTEDLLKELEWQVLERAHKGFCANLRQLHDSYALSSKPPKARKQA